MGDSGHEQVLSRGTLLSDASNLLSGALLPWRQSYVITKASQP